MNIQMHHLYKKENRRRDKPFNSQLLTMNEDIRNQYKTELKLKKEQQTEWNDIQNSITLTAKVTNGYLNRVHNSNNIYCNEIAILSQQQKHLRQKISNCKDVEKIIIWKWKEIRYYIRYGTKLKNTKNNYYNAKGNAHMFKAVKMLNRKQYENPSIHDKKVHQL